MRLPVLLVMLCVFGQASFAQTDFWLPGARWMYYNPNSGAPPEQHHFIYLGDTLMNGYSDVKILKKETRVVWSETWTEYHESESYFAQSNDSIFQLIDGDLQLMFDFNVDAGDLRVVNLVGWGCLQTDTMFIDSISTITYQDEELTAYYFHLLIDDQLSSIGEQAYYFGGG